MTSPDTGVWWQVQIPVGLPEFIFRVSKYMQEVTMFSFGALLSIKQSWEIRKYKEGVNASLKLAFHDITKLNPSMLVAIRNSPHIAFFQRVTGLSSQWSCRPAYHLPLNLIKASLHCSSLDERQKDEEWVLFKTSIFIQKRCTVVWCDSLRVKLDVHISSQVWFIVAADLKK